MTIVLATGDLFDKALLLLNRNELPTADINRQTYLFVAEENNVIAGTIAVEFDQATALLRSLSVDIARRNAGIGKALVDFIEHDVMARGIEAVYILTTTAEEFFFNRGYLKVQREDIPTFIRQTSEYSSLCPSSAIIMKKELISIR